MNIIKNTTTADCPSCYSSLPLQYRHTTSGQYMYNFKVTSLPPPLLSHFLHSLSGQGDSSGPKLLLILLPTLAVLFLLFVTIVITVIVCCIYIRYGVGNPSNQAL